MEPKVALVNMPWAPISEPSLGLAVLKAQLTQEGIESRIFHLSLGLMRHITGGAYQQISNCWSLNEFTFTGILDPQLTPLQTGRLMERSAAGIEIGSTQPFNNAVDLGHALIRMRHELVPQYLTECAQEILDFNPTMVGFSCMFDQALASVALATLLRERRPDLLVVCGGYALEGPPGIELVTSFPQIDGVAVGDGEPIIGDLARASVNGSPLHEIPGVITREHPYAKPRRKFDIKDSPEPDYDDWYADLAARRERDKLTIRTTVLPVESSRGCWWGQKHHCVFCGIDGETLKYRSKPAERVLDLLSNVQRRYGPGVPMRFSDYIFPHHFFSELLPQLATLEPRYELHCEIKANQTTERVKAFADAGFSELQPGIESFDSDVLRLMDKGVTGIQNVYLLKQGFQSGIQINYNILYGIPKEASASYVRMTAMLPRLFHLTPPVTCSETIVTRFAPMHDRPACFGVSTKPRHHPCYDTLFSAGFLAKSGFTLDNYAYYFDRYYDYEEDAQPLYWQICRQVDQWKKQHRERDVTLSWESAGDRVRIRDSRHGELTETTLTTSQSALYSACNHVAVRRQFLTERSGVDAESLDRDMDVLDSLGLIWTEGDLVLGLATPHAIVTAHCARRWQQRWTSLYA